jgi:enolase-phosphatase E1
VSVSLSAWKIRSVVLDIEGTTTPIEFVYQVLFPFARKHAPDYLAREWEAEGCRAAVAMLRGEHANDVTRGASPPAWADGSGGEVASVLAYVGWLMDRDRKSPGLKALQGLVWKDGYGRGDLRGQVFDDVPPALVRWTDKGLGVYIYSSGSVLAQQLLFGTTESGDLREFVRGYFDTAVGPKVSPESYRIITSRIEVPPPQVMFVSDVVSELDAAREAGLFAVLCVRPGGTDPPVSPHPKIRTFDDIVD